jgi:ABC-type branched-subunit amino acid transport system ATPase component
MASDSIQQSFTGIIYRGYETLIDLINWCLMPSLEVFHLYHAWHEQIIHINYTTRRLLEIKRTYIMKLYQRDEILLKMALNTN